MMTTINALIIHGGASKAGKKIDDALNEQPEDDRIRDRDFVNVAPLQLAEKIVDFHFFESAFVLSTFWIRAWKRGSLRTLS